ncbi:hypothetical protein EV359DRAFT_87351 [Lentinula novae-zelandiae]|nr:hypothetical protein EV359DRAFT_87351 [Lentinula novae-zelandiae]
MYFRIVQKLLTVVIEPPTENPAPLSTSNPRQLPSFMPAGPRKRPDDGVQSILLEDLLKTAEKSYLTSVRHNDAMHLCTLRSVVEVKSSKATNPMSVVVDPSLNLYTTRTAANEGISMDYSPGDLDGYTFHNPILSGELQDSEEVSLEDLDFHSHNVSNLNYCIGMEIMLTTTSRNSCGMKIKVHLPIRVVAAELSSELPKIKLTDVQSATIGHYTAKSVSSLATKRIRFI